MYVVVVFEVKCACRGVHCHLQALNLASFHIVQHVVDTEVTGHIARKHALQGYAVNYAVCGQFVVVTHNVVEHGGEDVLKHCACLNFLCRAIADAAIVVGDEEGGVGNSSACAHSAVGITHQHRHFHTTFKGGILSATEVACNALSAGAVV